MVILSNMLLGPSESGHCRFYLDFCSCDQPLKWLGLNLTECGTVASSLDPGRVGGEKWSGIDCLHVPPFPLYFCESVMFM